MNWWIVTIVLAVVCLISIALLFSTDLIWPIVTAVLSGVLVFALIVVCVVGTISAPKEIALFESQKQYIESHSPDDPIENAAITTKKVELNEWLFNAQYSNDRWGGWSFYPDSVRDIEPIE